LAPGEVYGPDVVGVTLTLACGADSESTYGVGISRATMLPEIAAKDAYTYSFSDGDRYVAHTNSGCTLVLVAKGRAKAAMIRALEQAYGQTPLKRRCVCPVNSRETRFGALAACAL
jgi:hypothetical protein